MSSHEHTFETSSDGAVDHYGKWKSSIYREQRHAHERTLENTRAILSHMVEDLSTWHQFRTARRKGIEFCKDHEHEERRQELKNDLAKAKTIYAEVLKGYQKGEAEPPQRKFFREFVDGLGNALEYIMDRFSHNQGKAGEVYHLRNDRFRKKRPEDITGEIMPASIGEAQGSARNIKDKSGRLNINIRSLKNDFKTIKSWCQEENLFSDRIGGVRTRLGERMRSGCPAC